MECALIIDDNQLYVYTFTKLAEKRKLCNRLCGFYSGQDAISWLANPQNKNNLPDVIFLDIYMPEMSGWEFLQAYREIKPQLYKNISIFLVTSSLNKVDMDRAKTFPEVERYFVKPSNEQEMITIFNTAKQSSSLNFQQL
jgi:CheY-like chemotaxis protein